MQSNQESQSRTAGTHALEQKSTPTITVTDVRYSPKPCTQCETCAQAEKIAVNSFSQGVKRPEWRTQEAHTSGSGGQAASVELVDGHNVEDEVQRGGVVKHGA